MRVALIEPQDPIRDVLAAGLRSAGVVVVDTPADADAIVLFVDAPVPGWATRVEEAIDAAHGAVVLTHIGPHPPALAGTTEHARVRRPFAIPDLVAALHGVPVAAAPVGGTVADAAQMTVDVPVEPHPTWDIVTRAFATTASNLLDVWIDLEHAERVEAVSAFLHRYRSSLPSS